MPPLLYFHVLLNNSQKCADATLKTPPKEKKLFVFNNNFACLLFWRKKKKNFADRLHTYCIATTTMVEKERE